ncbi:MAG: tRNA (adenosine(37)-N6)-threonylcarbamoyltransferase complex transferase subunit TsaD [Defluviitaleaceae bacterium]|nr:tRNA (adenosine(37)-N6)-threonylcarbamoyltransferase complex transferase subunit TsaD [Defluviitaleaceae bacterium]
MTTETVILGIETSCDETAAAVVVNGRKVLSNVIASQVETHRQFGGVVPEIAARKHLENISFIVEEALKQANLTLSDINGIAVSNGPGLVGALLVGLSYAKSLAFARRIPLLGVHHIYSHICANYLNEENFWEPPFICLVVSGGHTHLLDVQDYHNCNILGRTRDDAAGEAFDKVGRTLGLPYPGGPEIDKLSKIGDSLAISFPKTVFKDSLDFSFSGLKSAVLQYLHKNKGQDIDVSNVAASFQQSVIDVLVSNTLKACEQKGITKVALAGGVAANGGLRESMYLACANKGLSLNLPSIVYCTDNAAMVASGGYYHYIGGRVDSYNLNAYPNMDI